MKKRLFSLALLAASFFGSMQAMKLSTTLKDLSYDTTGVVISFLTITDIFGTKKNVGICLVNKDLYKTSLNFAKENFTIKFTITNEHFNNGDEFKQNFVDFSQKFKDVVFIIPTKERCHFLDKFDSFLSTFKNCKSIKLINKEKPNKQICPTFRINESHRDEVGNFKKSFINFVNKLDVPIKLFFWGIRLENITFTKLKNIKEIEFLSYANKNISLTKMLGDKKTYKTITSLSFRAVGNLKSIPFNKFPNLTELILEDCHNQNKIELKQINNSLDLLSKTGKTTTSSRSFYWKKDN
jgi:hypothetical protein